MRIKRSSLAYVTVTLLSWAGLWGLSFNTPVMAQETMDQILTVTGSGSVSVETSIAVINLGVLIDGTSAQSVQAQVAQDSNQLIEALTALNVEKLETTGISLTPQYDYRGSSPQQTGVRGQNSVKFEVSIDRAGTILDQAIEAGASQVQSIQFKAEDGVIKEARQQALQVAVQDAQDQADAVLSALNLSARSVAGIEVNSDRSGFQPIPFQAGRTALLSSVAEAEPTPVVGGEQVVSARVTLKISY